MKTLKILMRLFGNMLKRKCFRDIKNNLSQFVTIFLMIFIGVMAYCGIEAYMMGMQKTASEFYKVNNLQDLNVIGSNFSKDDLNSVKNLMIIHIKLFSNTSDIIKHRLFICS